MAVKIAMRLVTLGSITIDNLSVNGFLLYAHLLLDVSDSMRGLMGPGSPTDPTKLKVAVDAALELNNWVNDFSDG